MTDGTMKVAGAGDLTIVAKTQPGAGNVETSGKIRIGADTGARVAFMTIGNPEQGWVMAGFFTGSKKMAIQQLDKDLNVIASAFRTVEITSEGEWQVSLGVDMGKRGATFEVEGIGKNFLGLKGERYGSTAHGFAVRSDTIAYFSDFKTSASASDQAAGKPAKPTAPFTDVVQDYQKSTEPFFKSGLGSLLAGRPCGQRSVRSTSISGALAGWTASCRPSKPAKSIS